MSSKPDAALRLLIVDDSVEDAESIVSALRNAGIAVRPVRPDDLAGLAAQIESQPIDLVLAAQDAASIPIAEVIRAAAASGKDLPVIGLLGQVDLSRAAEAYLGGARRLALRHEPEQLLRSIRLEWEDLEARRALRRLETQVRETERRCDALIESSRDPIAYVHEGMHIRANSAYLEMFGFDDFEDVEGMSLLDLVAPQHVEDFKALLKGMAKGEAPPPRYELQARDALGTPFAAVMEFTQATYEGEPCLQVVFRRRQEADPDLMREVEELRQRDQATGLLNRPTFLRALEDAVADAGQNRRQHGLLLIEPDHYQRLLHEIGLDSADAIVAALAGRLRGALGENAVAARFSEHSFAVLLEGADHADTSAAAERIRDAFSDVLAVGDSSSMVTASIGGVQIGEKIASVGQVLARANDGVQSALGVGGNRIELFDPSAVDRAEEERMQAWAGRLRAALAGGDFVLHYQPVISLHGARSAIYEAFVRLDGGDGDPIPPLAFLSVAEEHGLLAPIDRWVAGRAIRTIARRDRGLPVTLMVKVSQASLADDALLKYLQGALGEHRVPGAQLVLALSESKVFTQLQAARAFTAAARELGCQVCLEHFGMGLDSFQLLSHLAPSMIKLDRSFTEDLPGNAENQQRIRDIAQRARAAGILTMAEFVQDAASMPVLFSAGIDYVQGNFLAPAGPEMNYDFD